LIFLTKEDFIYFLLISIDQLMLNPEDVKLIMLGDIGKTDDTYSMIHQYIKNYTLFLRMTIMVILLCWMN